MSHENRDYVEQLQKYGYRVTMQRLIVLDAVCDVDSHATIAEIVERVNELDPTIDQSTIYRALDVLTKAELVVTSEIDGVGKVYEIKEAEPHHHLVCKVCGDVMSLDHEIVQPVIERIQDEHGFYVETDHLIFSGVCSKCKDGQ